MLDSSGVEDRADVDWLRDNGAPWLTLGEAAERLAVSRDELEHLRAVGRVVSVELEPGSLVFPGGQFTEGGEIQGLGCRLMTSRNEDASENYQFFDRKTGREITVHEWQATFGAADPIATDRTPTGKVLTFWKGLTRKGESPTVYTTFLHREGGEAEMLAGYMTFEEAKRGHDEQVVKLNAGGVS